MSNPSSSLLCYPNPFEGTEAEDKNMSLPSPDEPPPENSLPPASFISVWSRIKRILTDGPASHGEWWIYELMRWGSGHQDAKYICFDIPALWLGFRLLAPGVNVSDAFYSDVCHLVTFLPLEDGQEIERTLLLDLIMASGSELGMAWAGENVKRARAAVIFGICHAATIHRRVSVRKTENELQWLMENLVLGQEAENDAKVMDMFADSFEDKLNIKL